MREAAAVCPSGKQAAAISEEHSVVQIVVEVAPYVLMLALALSSGSTGEAGVAVGGTDIVLLCALPQPVTRGKAINSVAINQ